MSMEMTAMSTLAHNNAPCNETESAGWPLFPVETEIYILPDGRVIVADLPAELASLLTALGQSEGATAASCALGQPGASVCHE